MAKLLQVALRKWTYLFISSCLECCDVLFFVVDVSSFDFAQASFIDAAVKNFETGFLYWKVLYK